MRRLLGVVLGITLVACGAVEGGPGDTPTSTTMDTQSSTSIQIPPTQEDSLPTESDQVSAAIADLARHLQIEPQVIELVEVRHVQWADGSLGCPQYGEVYTQAIIDGSQVMLQVDGRVYDYRADATGNVRLCPSDEKDGGYDFVPPPGFDEK